MTDSFLRYNPPYSLSELLERCSAILLSSAIVAYHLEKGTQDKIAAFVEAIDHCNA